MLTKKIKKLALVTIISCAPLTHTPQARTDNTIDTTIILTGAAVTAVCGFVVLCWKGLTESNKHSQLAADKESINDVKQLDPKAEFGSILNALNNTNDNRNALAKHLLLKQVSLDKFHQDITDYQKTLVKKLAVLQTNRNHWKNNTDYTKLLHEADNVYRDAYKNKLTVIKQLDRLCENNYAYVKLYQTYKFIENQNYYNPKDPFQYVNAADQMNENYNQLNAIIQTLNYNQLDSDFQELFTSSRTEMETISHKRKQLVHSQNYKNEILLREQIKQQEQNREVIEKRNRIEQQKADTQERKARAVEKEAKELRKQNQLEQNRRNQEHIFAPEFRNYEQQIRTLQNEINCLIKENSYLDSSNTKLVNKVSERNETIFALKQEIKKLLQKINNFASDEETEENKELKKQILKLQQSVNNPPCNPQSDMYVQWLTNQVDQLGK